MSAINRAAGKGAMVAMGGLLAAKALQRWNLAKAFRGKVILITGGSRGLGLVMARRLGRMRARLVLIARDPHEVKEAEMELKSAGVDTLGLIGDVTDPEVCKSAVQQTMARFGALDVLINNAGVIIIGPHENMSEADYEETMRIHFWAPLYLVKAALPYLTRSRGRIVNIASLGGLAPIPHMMPYVASKFALIGWSGALHVELARQGVSVTTVAPMVLRSGSHMRAFFKGKLEREFAWFALSGATPLSSMAVERAAAQIIEAAYARRSFLTVGWQARLLQIASGVTPRLTHTVLRWVNRLLPSAPPRKADKQAGLYARGSFPPRALTILPDAASLRNNESFEHY